MSSYEDYDAASGGYDRTRWPIGLEIIVGCLAQGVTPLHRMTVLDAGCGTGNYAHALQGHVARIEAVDLSAGMLAIARAKLADAEAGGRIVFHQGSIAALPFGDATLDGAMVNQVLHHLEDDPEAGYPAHRQVLAELARVLRPGAVLTINACSQAQMQGAFWANSLIPEARRTAMARRIMPLDALAGAMAEAGLEVRGRFVPVDALMQGPDYLDPQGPLRPEWRAGDSIWALLDPAELAAIEATLRELDRQGALERYLAKHDARRPLIGQITILYGIRR
jgi:ubiquinone/menaquinone biosynthesis C-methylase UbiE